MLWRRWGRFDESVSAAIYGQNRIARLYIFILIFIPEITILAFFGRPWSGIFYDNLVFVFLVCFPPFFNVLPRKI
jgi:hypothetical protein